MLAARCLFRPTDCANAWMQWKSTKLSSAGQCGLLAVKSNAAFALLTSRQHAYEDAIKLLDGKILAHVTVSTGMKRRLHLLFVISDSCEDDDRKSWVHLPNESDQRNAVHLRHLKIDNGDFAVMLGEPGCSLEPIGQGLAGMTALTQIRDQKFCNTRVVINKEELAIFAFGRLHLYNFHTE